MNSDSQQSTHGADERSEKGDRKTIQAEYVSFSLFIDFEIEKYKKKVKTASDFYQDFKKNGKFYCHDSELYI